MRLGLREALVAAALAAPVAAQFGAAPEPPRIDWEQRPGAQLPWRERFTDQDGRDLSLAQCFAGRPVVLALVYYECPMLCDLVFEGLVESLRALDFEPGRDFDVLALSIDPRETAGLARAKRDSCLERYGRGGEGWRFLVGEEAAIRSVAEAVGFGYSYVPERDEWAHAAGITVVTGEGAVSRVLYGVEFAPRDLRFALIEAAQGRIGTPVDKFLLLCFHYDPAQGRYGFAILSAVRGLGAATVLLLGLLIARWIRRERLGAPGSSLASPPAIPAPAGLEPGGPGGSRSHRSPGSRS